MKQLYPRGRLSPDCCHPRRWTQTSSGLSRDWGVSLAADHSLTAALILCDNCATFLTDLYWLLIYGPAYRQIPFYRRWGKLLVTILPGYCLSVPASWCPQLRSIVCSETWPRARARRPAATAPSRPTLHLPRIFFDALNIFVDIICCVLFEIFGVFCDRNRPLTVSFI